MKYIFLKSGTAKEVFEAFARAVLVERLLEMKFGRLIESLETIDFSWN